MNFKNETVNSNNKNKMSSITESFNIVNEQQKYLKRLINDSEE